MQSGYIKLHRSILDNPIFQSKPFSKGLAWITLLLLTNHKENLMPVKNGQMLKIKRGECGYSELALANIFGWSRGKVKRFLTLLESEKMIQQKIVANHSIIRILKYSEYQYDTTNGTTNDTTNGQQTIQQTDINNNDKNDKNIEEEKNYVRYGKEYQNVYLKKEHYTRLLNASMSMPLLNEIIEDYSYNIERGKEKRFDLQYPNAHYLGLMAYLKQRKKNPKIVPMEEKHHYRPA